MAKELVYDPSSFFNLYRRLNLRAIFNSCLIIHVTGMERKRNLMSYSHLTIFATVKVKDFLDSDKSFITELGLESSEMKDSKITSKR